MWQDGSTDSTFTAFNIGKYWVRVQDSCGGVQSDTIRVNLAASPPLDISPDTFRICEGDSIVVNAPTGFTSYRWSPSVGVNDTFRRQITLTPSVSGTYYCAASTAQGCVNQDSIFVNVTPLTCLTKSETVCGGTYKIGDSTFSKSGNYRIILRGRAAACDTVVSLNLKINNVKIETQVFNACPNQRNGRIVATAKNGSLPYTFAWNTGARSPELNNLAAGMYRLTVTDANNCTDTTSVILKGTLQYLYSFSVKNPKCYGEPRGEIRLNSTEKLTFGFDSTASNKTGFVANLRADSYTVFVKDSNNCVFSQTISITQPPPLTLVLQADTIIRLGDSLRIKPDVSGGTGRLKYRWQPIQALNCDTCKTVVAKPTTAITTLVDTSRLITIPNVTETTCFQLLFEKNNCRDTLPFCVRNYPSYDTLVRRFACQPSDTGLIVKQLRTFRGCDSIVRVQSVLNSKDTTRVAQQVCNKADTGIILLKLRNTEGCDSFVLVTRKWLKTDTTRVNIFTCFPKDTGIVIKKLTSRLGCDSFVLTNTYWFQTTFMDIGADTVADIGSRFNLVPILRGDSIESFSWQPPLGLSCTTCRSPEVVVPQTVLYSLTAVNRMGCAFKAERLVRAVDKPFAFVPNVFSPNGDGTNETLTVFANPNRVQSVKSLFIYNRWGELVFSKQNFAINDENAGWDGFLRGEKAAPDVYVYVLELLLFDKQVKLLSGDFTLMR